MKSSKFMLLLALLNLGVAAGVMYYVFGPKPETPAAMALPDAVTAAVPETSPEPVPTPAEPVVVVTNQFRWAQLESEDYKTYIARLRSIGCPEQTIRDIIIADLDKLLAPEVAKAQGRRADLKYWHSEEEEMLNDVDPRDVFRKQRELDQRKREIIRELVNADLARERMKQSGEEDYYERRLGFLAEERRTQVREVLEKFDEAERQLQDKDSLDPVPLPAMDQTKLRLLRQQREEAIGTLMSPQEKSQYDLWLSPTANEIRHALYGMDASEQEFLAIYEARKAFETAWSERNPDLLDVATREQMEAARGDMEGQIEQSLGPERYAEYKRGQDHDFHLLSALTTQYKLPKQAAAEIYNYKVVARGYREQVAANAELTLEQKKAALREIVVESRKTVAATLGAKAFNHYLRSGQANWLDE